MHHSLVQLRFTVQNPFEERVPLFSQNLFPVPPDFLFALINCNGIKPLGKGACLLQLSNACKYFNIYFLHHIRCIIFISKHLKSIKINPVVSLVIELFQCTFIAVFGLLYNCCKMFVIHIKSIP